MIAAMPLDDRTSPPIATAPARRSSAERWFVAAWAAFVVLLALAVAGLSLHSFSQELERTERSLQRTARLLAGGLEPVLLGAGIAVAGVQAIRRHEEGRDADAYAQTALEQTGRLVPHTTYALLLDEAGTVVAASDPHIVGRGGFLELLRRYYPVPRDEPVVVGPLAGGISGQEILVLVARAPTAAGEDGTVLVGIDLEPIRASFAAGSMRAEDTVLFTTDAVALLSVPRGLFEAGRAYPRGRLFRLLEAGMAEGVYRGVNPANGRERIIAFKRVSAGPLVASVGVDVLAVFQAWLRGNAALLLASAMLVLLGAGLALASGRVLRARRVALAEAERAARDRVRFLAHASHELRTPLNAVIGFADLLLSPAGGPLGDRARGYAESIRAGGEHLLKVVNDILDHSRLLAGQAKAEFAPVPLADCIAAAARLVRLPEQGGPQLEARGLDGALLDADGRLVVQVLLNLYANAAHPEIGSTAVETSCEAVPGGGLAVLVRDDGIGIPEDVAARVLPMFADRDPHVRSATGGAGLGLAIAAGIMRLHGGTISARRLPGRGTEVRLEFPPGRVLAPPGPAAQGGGTGGAGGAAVLSG